MSLLRLALILVALWIAFGSVVILAVGVTPGRQPCMFTGPIGAAPLTEQERDAACARLWATDGAAWDASLSPFQRLTQEPQVWVVWYVVPLVLIVGGGLLVGRRTSISAGAGQTGTNQPS